MDSSCYLGKLYFVQVKSVVYSKNLSLINLHCFFVQFSSGFFPVAINFLRRVPILGRLLNLPGISMVKSRSYANDTDLKMANFVVDNSCLQVVNKLSGEYERTRV